MDRHNHHSDEFEHESEDLLQMPNFLDLLTIAWRRRSLLALAVVAAVVLASLYYAQKTPIYESEAQVLVVQKRPDVVTGTNMHLSQFDDYITTHRVLIQSPLVVERAIKQDNLRKLKMFAHTEEDITDAIIARLSVGRASKDTKGNPNSVLQLAFRGPEPLECGVVVNSILDSYKQFLDETYRDMSEDTVSLITQARDVLQNDLSQHEAGYRQFRQNSPLMWNSKGDVNPRQDRLAMIESQRSSLILRRAQIESDLATVTKAQQAGRTADELVALISDLAAQSDAETSTRRSSLSLQEQLFPLLLEEQRLLEDYGPNHPHVKAVRTRVEATRNFFALPSAAYSKATDKARAGVEVSAELIELYIAYLRNELDRLKTTEQLLAELYDTEHQAARELTSYEMQDEEFRRNIARTEGLYDGIVKQLQDASFVKDYGGFEARVIAPAGIGEKVAPKALFVFPGAMFLGLLAGCGLVYVAEITDKSFRTPEEIRSALGLPIVGHIPNFEPDALTLERATANGSSIDPMVCTYYETLSAGAEAYRGIRTALYFSSGGAEHRVLQVTSPKPSDGKSTLAANVAVSIAQSGKRTLLIDADLRKPRQHHVFGISADVGLSSVIAFDTELDDAIHETAVANLSLMPCGPIPPDPAELLSSPRLAELLNVVRERYDYVIVDTAPVLAVTDPCAVAPRVDGVILTIRVSKHGRKEAQRAKEILTTLDAKIVGVVVNGFGSADSKGYGYEAYGYAYSDAYRNNGNGHVAPEPASRV